MKLQACAMSQKRSQSRTARSYFAAKHGLAADPYSAAVSTARMYSVKSCLFISTSTAGQ